MRVAYQLSEKDMLEAHGKHGGPGEGPAGGWPSSRCRWLGVSGAESETVSEHRGLDGDGFVPYVSLEASSLAIFSRGYRLRDKFAAVISDSEVDVSSSTATLKYSWNPFIRYAETKNLFLVYPSPRVFNILPKRAFNSGGSRHISKSAQSKVGQCIECLPQENQRPDVGVLRHRCHYSSLAGYGHPEHSVGILPLCHFPLLGASTKVTWSDAPRDSPTWNKSRKCRDS